MRVSLTKKESIKRTVAMAALGLTLYFLATGWSAIASTSGEAESGQEDKPAEQAFKNIQVLKGMPPSQLLPVMHLMRTALGVRCDYCHVAENGKYWMDDKPTKQTTRRMIQMVLDINKTNFGGRLAVTCNTCHRGQTAPVAVPFIGQGVFENTTRAEPGAKAPDPLPAVDEVLDKYAQALGGKAALERVTTRVSKVSLARPKLVGGGTPYAHMVTRGETWSLEIYQKAPNKYLAIVTTPDAVLYQGFNGTVGWIKSPDGTREMNPAELARIKRQADLYRDLNIKEQLSKMIVVGKEKIADREAYVVEALNANNKSEKLFFDVQTGLLLRRTLFTETVLGLDPEQTDYEDYRDVNGLKIPFTVRVSYLDDSHYGTTRKLTVVKQNVSLDDAKFDMPQPRQ